MNRGDVVLQKNSFSDPFSILIWLRSSRYGHCGIYLGDGKMVASDLVQGGVCIQDAGAADSHAVPVKWAVDFESVVMPWLIKQLDQKKPYDFLAWLRILFFMHTPIIESEWTCSSLVGAALSKFAGFNGCRETTPDEVARFLGA